MRLLRSARLLLVQVRKMGTQGLTGTRLVYEEYGDPMKVVMKCPAKVPNVHATQLLVRMLAAPVNPADINTIQGKYPSKPPLPATPGNEGVGEVIAIGDQVTKFACGDRVVPLSNMLGTWQSHTVLDEHLALKVPERLGIAEASTLTVNPCTAYRMLKDFIQLKKGDVVIQNGANSACGQNVIQLCSAWGYHSINIVRDRPNICELKSYLMHLGASAVLTEEELRTTKLFKEKYARPKLALNCVGGKSATELMRTLDHSGSIVTYGGMSREPLTVGTAMLIFKNIHVRGFWATEWAKQNANTPERWAMFEELIELMLQQKLQAPVHKLVSIDNYKEALQNTLTVGGMTGQKYILTFDDTE